ncbi:hypothetical protein [Tychonema sp. LEGE 07203]|nr:hypothetical protein [Tychonema sp. LEGE 07203]
MMMIATLGGDRTLMQPAKSQLLGLGHNIAVSLLSKEFIASRN